MEEVGFRKKKGEVGRALFSSVMWSLFGEWLANSLACL